MRGNWCRIAAFAFALTMPAISAYAAAVSKTIHIFTGRADGGYPEDTLIQDARGNLYGTTFYGGKTGPNCVSSVNGSPSGCGVVFRLTKPTGNTTKWTATVLYTFAGSPDGANPIAGLVFDKAGNLYGATGAGGGGKTVCKATAAGAAGGCGTVFKLSPPPTGNGHWTETILASFSGQNGAGLTGTPIFDPAGNLYDTASAGGAENAKCPANPSLGTAGGCGLAFKLSPSGKKAPWTQTVLHTFGAGVDGIRPLGGLILDKSGNLYGTTLVGGTINKFCPATAAIITIPAGCGVVFKLSPPAAKAAKWSETILDSFAGFPHPANSYAGLAMDPKGNLYGTTYAGGQNGVTAGTGTSAGGGTVFKLTPTSGGKRPWTETILRSFGAAPDGAQPRGGLIFDPSGNLYGTTAYGGKVVGTVFELTPPKSGATAWTEKILHNFLPNEGLAPVAGLVRATDGSLYGTAVTGAVAPYTNGTVFELMP